MAERPLITVSFRPGPRVDGLRALRALLKIAWRRFGLRCTQFSHDPPLFQESTEGRVACECGIAAHGPEYGE